MINGPRGLRFGSFNSADPKAGDPLAIDPVASAAPRHAKYLLCYLADLGAVSFVEEPNYFDRDFLAEFAAFYGTSARGYPNTCRRVHYFSIAASREKWAAALGGDAVAEKELRDSYLGFVVLRPIAATPFGRTVLRWYEDLRPLPRVAEPSHPYDCHVGGLRLSVHGLAWQQQDTGVGACATIALWTMLHSSAFDPNHAIPTTATITQFAHRTASLGARVFPSKGLVLAQLGEVVKECVGWRPRSSSATPRMPMALPTVSRALDSRVPSRR